MEERRRAYSREWAAKNRLKRAEYRKQWRKANPEKLRAQQQRYRQSHKTAINLQRQTYRATHREQIRLSWRRYSATHPEQIKSNRKRWRKTPKARYYVYVKHARRLGVVFRLSFDQFKDLLYQPCHYCTVKPATFGGIDRKLPRLGYTIDNCVPCCWPCNWFKGKRDYKIFLSHVLRIRNA